MAGRVINAIVTRPWLRIGLAVGLLVAGLAPVGAPIVSESSRRLAQGGPEAVTVVAAQPFMYQTAAGADGSTRVERSDDGGATWHEVSALPVPVEQLVAAAGNEQVIYARTPDSIWLSEDAGATWSRTASLPSRPDVLAVAGEQSGTVYVGTESMGLFRSNNRGESWQNLDSPAFAAAGTAPLDVTALAINPEDQQIVYAATGFWLGTNPARYNPLGLFVSVDGGSHWFEMSRAALGSSPVEKIEPIAGNPLAAVTVDTTGEHRTQMGLSDKLLASLNDPDPGVRAAAARVIGLTGDAKAAPALLDHMRTDTNIVAGAQMADALGRLGDRAVIPALMDTLSSGDEALQSRAAHALGLLGATQAVPLLAETLDTGAPMAQRSAAEALAVLGTPDAIAALETPLSSAAMTSARNAAMIGLEAAGNKSVGTLTQALQSANPTLRANAAEMLGWIKAPSATPELSQALSDSSVAVRQQAAWALGEIDTPDSRQAVAQALQSETNSEVRGTLEAAVARDATSGAGNSAAATGWFAGVLAVLATVPVTKWAFMTLATALAVFVLLAGSWHVHGGDHGAGARSA
jgi:HEAT repeat protein